MPRRRRAGVVAAALRIAGQATVLAAVLALAVPGSAAAHALRSASDPAAGATLATPPTSVSITFTERPDPRLSSIRVLDANGAELAAGPVTADPANPATLLVALKPLDGGVFTVSWRTVSSVDGHAASGTFAFGVGATPQPATAGSTEANAVPPPSPGLVAARICLYVGLILLLGAAIVALVVTRAPPAQRTVLATGAVMTAAGTVGVIVGSAAVAGIDVAQAAGSSLGPLMAARLAAGGVCVLLSGLAAIGRTGPIGRVAGVLLGAAVAAAMLADVLAGHAAGGATPITSVVLQWLHIVAIGAWLGSLTSLLVAVRGAPSDETGAYARRFALLAPVGITLVAVTGVLRAVAEVQTIDALIGTDFGRLVIVKGALLAMLAVLGAINHFRMVPLAARALRGLRRVGSAELAIGLVALLATGVLVDLTPPAYAAPPVAVAPPASLTAVGADFGTSVRARLAVVPGAVGFNRFSLHVEDFDTATAVPATTATLRLALPARSDVAASSLTLDRQPDGSFAATGANLSLAGTWRMTATVATDAGSVEVPLQMTVSATPWHIEANAVPGAPTIYTIHLDAGNAVQVYADPGVPGPTDFHATFFDASGAGLPATDPTLSMVGPSGGQITLEPRVLEPGHFVASLETLRGTYSLSIHATAPDGSPLDAVVDLPIGL